MSCARARISVSRKSAAPAAMSREHSTFGVNYIDEEATARQRANWEAAAANPEEEIEECEYLFVSLEEATYPPADVAGHEMVIERLLTSKPKVTIAGVKYASSYEDDIGSTLYFDRTALRRVADAHARELDELELAPDEELEAPPVCVTSKRLCVR